MAVVVARNGSDITVLALALALTLTLTLALELVVVVAVGRRLRCETRRRWMVLWSIVAAGTSVCHWESVNSSQAIESR